MTPTPTLIAVAVVEHDDQFLIGPRPAAAVLSGFWEFPGGKVRVHDDESPEQAACRECLEETGLEIRVLSRFPSHVHRYEYGDVDLRFFSCAPLDPSAVPREPFRWVSRASLPGYRFPAGNRMLLNLLTGE